MAAVLLLFAIRQGDAREIVITAVGDVMLAGSGEASYARLGYDHPFAATAAELRKGDIAVANLEAPITRGGEEFTGKKFRYRSMPRAATALKRAGFTVVTLANNHLMDFGAAGLTETLRHLDRSGIAHTGGGASLAAARREAVVTVRGTRVAFLAYSLTYPAAFFAGGDRPGTAPGYARYVREDIAKARANADYVVVSFHWGEENAAEPKPYQVTLARQAVDAGAAVVIGHHPHVLQGIERYKGGVIFYSLGNFAFGTLSKSADRSVIARVTLGTGVPGVELVPLNVLNREVRFQPRVLEGREGQRVIDRLVRISRQWRTVISSAAGRFLVEPGSTGRLARN